VVRSDQLLRVLFSVFADPTLKNRQGPDAGTQYRSTIFAMTPAQQDVAAKYIAQLDQAGAYGRPIVTTIETGKAFYPAEDYHQNYLALHPREPYIAINDLPKVENLKRLFPERYRDPPVLVSVALH
jgi:peptide-methionine (S)-S-oxide reductase